MGKKEKDSGARCCVRIVNKRDVYLTELGNENDYLRLKRIRGRHFTFDASFPESTTQLEVYSTTTAELVEAVLQGRNGSVFCYGATGAGKTHTMLGSVESPGVMVLAIKDLFNKIRQRSFDGNHVVHLSYLEVYNESVRDLLSPGRPLVLREDKQRMRNTPLPESETDQAKLLLELQKENRELRMQFARQQQKLLAVQAQALAANSSPAPSKVVSHLSPAPSSAQANEKRRTRSSLLSRNCFTPESKRKEADLPCHLLATSFWDITTANSPSLATLNGRKTRSHVASETTVAPSMLLQPGFARQKQ
ncbi:hypothetical protein Leryth_006138 [Lithospermum erythrorhizon]|nr:hypothetical protein Leryth_006138 [Lithospermum erythrorhizon]